MSDTPPGSKPNYGSAIRVAQIVHWLHENPYGLSLQELRNRLGISERTLARYIQTLKESFFDEEGEPLVEVVRGASQGRLRFKRKGLDLEGSAYELMSLYMGLDMMSFLSGTFIQEDAQTALDRMQTQVQRQHGNQTALLMKDFHKKFVNHTETPKDYSDANAVLDRLVKALVLQREVVVLYRRRDGGEKRHQLKPLSLLMYKRGLYLIGRKQRDNGEEVELTLALEGIQNLSILEDKAFAYPMDYEPSKRFNRNFGLVQVGDPERVVLRFQKNVASNLAGRKIHTSQEMIHLDDGGLELTMELAVSDELVGWILSWAHFCQVLEPKSLRDRVRERLELSLSNYT